MLSPTHRRIYEMIKGNLTVRHEAPTIMEICAAAGLKSTATGHAYLKELEREGLIVRSRKHRGIQLTEKS